MALSTREKNEILKTCDDYFDKDQDNYKVDKTQFIELIRIMLENENIADNMRGKTIWKKMKP
jgi:hypothetical protein